GLVTHQDPFVSGEAKKLLRQLGGGGAETELTIAVSDLKSNNPFARRDAAAKLANMPVDEKRRAEVTKALEGLLNDNVARGEAAKALAVWGGKDNANALKAMVLSPDPGTRRAAMETLGKLKEESAAGAIVNRLADPLDRPVAKAALEAIGPGAQSEVV